MIEININSKPYNWLIHHICIRSIKRELIFVNGYTLDIGCGMKPYSHLLAPLCSEYIGIDRPGANKADVHADALYLPFSDESFDSVVSFQVMEHVPEPLHFLTEMKRVMKCNGHAIITTPFIWSEHEIPNDYFRFTRYGLKYLAEAAGFEVVSITPDTGALTAASLRIVYWLNHLRLGPIRPLLYPFYALIQLAGYLLDKISPTYDVAPATFTTVLKKYE